MSLQVGKTALLCVQLSDRFPEHIPEVFENDETYIRLDRATIKLLLFDSDGREAFSRIRMTHYHKADVVLVCYSIDDRDSFEHVRTRWIHEVRQQVPGAAVFLVALKLDLYGSIGAGAALVTQEEGHGLAVEIGAAEFFECSALKLLGVHDIFGAAGRVVWRRHLASSYRRCVVC